MQHAFIRLATQQPLSEPTDQVEVLIQMRALPLTTQSLLVSWTAMSTCSPAQHALLRLHNNWLQWSATLRPTALLHGLPWSGLTLKVLSTGLATRHPTRLGINPCWTRVILQQESVAVFTHQQFNGRQSLDQLAIATAVPISCGTLTTTTLQASRISCHLPAGLRLNFGASSTRAMLPNARWALMSTTFQANDQSKLTHSYLLTSLVAMGQSCGYRYIQFVS